MRLARIGLWLAAALLLAGCFEVETHITINQDGSGTYLQVVDLPRNLMELTLAQGRFRDLDDFMADSVINTQNALEGQTGVSLLDAGAEWVQSEGEPLCRVTMLFHFDGVEAWNKFAEIGRRLRIKLDTATGRSPNERLWTVSVLMPKVDRDAPQAGAGAPQPLAETGNEEGESGPGGEQEPQLNIGAIRVFVAGPAPAPPDNFAVTVPQAEAVRLDDGRVRFAGTFALLANEYALQARFAGPLLSAEQLTARKRAQQVEPSERFRRILQVVEQRREVERTRQAALQAVTDTRFELHLRVLADQRVELSYTRIYYGPTAAYFADREAMLHAMLPELAANYALQIERVAGPDNTVGLAVTRTRRQPLKLEDLGEALTVKQDGPELVYVLSLPPLLGDLALGDEAPPTLGLVSLEAPLAISGTNGRLAGANQAVLDLTPELLRGSPMLVVRTPAR